MSVIGKSFDIKIPFRFKKKHCWLHNRELTDVSVTKNNEKRKQ